MAIVLAPTGADSSAVGCIWRPPRRSLTGIEVFHVGLAPAYVQMMWSNLAPDAWQVHAERFSFLSHFLSHRMKSGDLRSCLCDSK